MDYIKLLRKEKEEELTDYCTGYKASKRNDVGNDPRLRFGSTSTLLFFFFLPLPLFFFLPQLYDPQNPSPAWLFIEKAIWGQGSSPQASWLPMAKGISWPRRARC